MTPQDLLDIAVVVRAQRGITPEDRWDLRQEIALRLWQATERPASVPAWALKIAADMTRDLVRDRRLHRELADELRDSPGRPYRRDPSVWEPAWYKPHPDAEALAPFVCGGARLMHVGGGSEGGKPNTVHDALVSYIASRQKNSQ